MTDTEQAHSEQERDDAGIPLWLRRFQNRELQLSVAYVASLPISIDLSQGIFIAGLLLWLLNAVSMKVLKLKSDTPSILAAPLAIPLFALALVITISGAVNGGAHAVHEAWKSLYSLKNLLPYFWAYFTLRRNKNAEATALVLLFWISAVAGVWGGIQQVFNIHPTHVKWLQGTGFHGHPMAFAGQMEIFSMLSLGFLLSSSYKQLTQFCPTEKLKSLFEFTQRNASFYFIVLANFAGLFFAGEKSAWLGGFAGVLAIALLKSWQLALKSVFGLSALSALSFICVPLVRTRIESMFSGHDPSISARQTIWHECLYKYFPQSPFIGIGWLKFPTFQIGDAIVSEERPVLIHAHSNYIQFLTTTGLIGLACYLYLIYKTLKVAAKKFRLAEDPLNKGVGMGLFGAAIALSVAGIFEYNFGTTQVRLAQWFLFGLL